MLLKDVPLHEKVRVVALGNAPDMKRRLMDLGFVQGQLIQPMYASISNGMRAYQIHDALFAIRTCEEEWMEVSKERDDAC